MCLMRLLILCVLFYVFDVFEVFEVGCLDGCAGWPTGLLATWQAGSGAEIIGPGGGIGIMEAVASTSDIMSLPLSLFPSLYVYCLIISLSLYLSLYILSHMGVPIPIPFFNLFDICNIRLYIIYKCYILYT